MQTSAIPRGLPRLAKMLILPLLLLLPSMPCGAALDWPAWRGRNGDGIYPSGELPLNWSRETNVRWKTPLPEPGNSTPIVWGDRVFVTQPVAAENRRTLQCFNRADGKKLWETSVPGTNSERTHETNPYASASPTTDGDAVYCWFGSAGVAAYDFNGKEIWRTDLGIQDHQFGYGGSPVLHEDRLFLNFGPGKREFVAALDKKTGKELWRRSAPIPPQDDIYGAWSTPVVADWNGQAQLISFLRGELAGLDPATGKVLWWTDKAGIQAKASPVVGEDVVVMAGDLKSAEVAVRLGGAGNVSETHLLWHRDPPKRRVGTGIIYRGHFYGVQTSGIADCRDLRTGETLWEERLRGPGSQTAIWGSPILAGDKLYVMNQSGDVFVWRASPKFEALAVSSMEEPANASVAPAHGGIFLRTHKTLWHIGNN